MKQLKKTLSFVFAVIMLMSAMPSWIYSSQGYTVTLCAGPEGQGESVALTKLPGQALVLADNRQDIASNYGLEPAGGNSDQRVFIKWSTSFDAKTGRGNGTDYYDSYSVDSDVTLYAIWGYPIMFNADGGRYADGSTKKLEYVANYAEWQGEATDPKSMYRYNMPDWNGDVPVKEGARRVGNGAGPGGKGYAYGLIREDGRSFFTWEGYGENLTIPPEGGAYYPSGNHNGATWAMFRCVEADDPDNPYGIAFPEFVAVWEPSVTYHPNGGEGDSYSEYLSWDWKLWAYEYYSIDKNSFTRDDGAEFIGWNTEPDGSGRSYSAGRRITSTPGKDSDPFTLYAQWSIPHTHEYSIGSESAPTCGAQGEIVYVCSCGDSYTEAVPATGEHSYNTTITDATCAHDGVITYTCSVCSDSYTESIPATGDHDYSEWIVSKEPTYFDDGYNERYCLVCGDSEVSIIAAKEYVNRFTDVKESHWFYDEVSYCVKRGYVSGMTETTFEPNGMLTRAQFIMLLSKLDGVDLSRYDGKDAGFEDVKSSHWWNSAICWAVEMGYTSGVSEKSFAPNDKITREQLARFFYVYTEKKGTDVSDRADLSAYEDSDKVSAWARDNVEWAVAKGLISGISDTELAPRGNATRAQAARIFSVYDTI